MAKVPTWRDDPQFAPFYKSRAWKRVRSVVLDRSHGLCERCADRGVVKPADVVHHTVPLNASNVTDPDIALNQERLLALCHECHTEVHQILGVGALNGHPPEEPRVRFDSEGNVVRL